jgi:Cof subfamily protein (haloacid dehalogenase superfamily)
MSFERRPAGADRRIRLIMADLDGTLLNSAHVVSPYTAAAIRQAQALGVVITFATGKTFPSTQDLIKQFDIRAPVVCGNGTQVFAPDGTLLHGDPIPLDFALESVRLARAHGMTVVVSTRTGLLSDVRDANVEELLVHYEPVPDLVPDLEDALRTAYQPYKVVLMNQDHAKVVAFQGVLERVFERRAQVLRSGLLSVVEVLPLGVTKGTALEVVCSRLGIQPGEAICFGDNCNDVDMLRRAGIGVAMGQSPEDVRSQADYVTESNDEDGVGHALHRFVLAPRDAAAVTAFYA